MNQTLPLENDAPQKSQPLDSSDQPGSHGAWVGVSFLAFFALVALIHVPAYLHLIFSTVFQSNIVRTILEESGLSIILYPIYKYTVLWIFT